MLNTCKLRLILLMAHHNEGTVLPIAIYFTESTGTKLQVCEPCAMPKIACSNLATNLMKLKCRTIKPHNAAHRGGQKRSFWLSQQP
jgi:hypothetical protein